MQQEFITREKQEEIRQQQIRQWTQFVKCKFCGKVFPRTCINGFGKIGIDASGESWKGCKCNIKNNNDLDIASPEEVKQQREIKQNE